MSTVNPELNYRKRKDGRYAILIRASSVIAGEQVHQRTNSHLFVTVKKHFNAGGRYGNWVSANEPGADKINEELQTKIEEIKEHFEKTGTVIVPTVTTGDGFFKFAQEFIEKYNNEKSYGTYKNYQSKLTKLAKYLGFERKKWEYIPVKLAWANINVQFIRNYTTHLQKIPNDTNTVSSDLSKIKAIINQAIKEDLAEYEKNPFRKIRLEKKGSKKEKLTAEELDLIRNLKLEPGTRVEHSRDIFLFCVNCLGMRIGDALNLKVKDVSGGRVFYQMRKTGDPVPIKLTKEAQAIADKYCPNKKPDQYLFPFVESKKANKIFLRVSSSTTTINEKLRYIAKLAGIEKTLSTHIARHTFAQLALNSIRKNNGSIDTLQKALRHSDAATTRIYAKELDNTDVDDLNDSIFGK